MSDVGVFGNYVQLNTQIYLRMAVTAGFSGVSPALVVQAAFLFVTKPSASTIIST